MGKKLYRSRSNKKIAGVCGGLAEYLDVDSTIIRIIFLVLLFFNGIGLILYIIMWLVLPYGPEILGKCQKCGSLLPENVRYCPNCGAEVETPKIEEAKEDKDNRGIEAILIIIGFLFIAWGIKKCFDWWLWHWHWHWYWFDWWDWWFVPEYGFAGILVILGIIFIVYGIKRKK